MTLRMERLAAQLPGFIDRYAATLEAMSEGLDRAGDALTRWSSDPATGDAAIRRAMEASAQPYALSLREPPAATFASPAPVPVTVVAADGSSIEPDRFAAVSCFVLNTGWAVLPYGVDGDPDLDSEPLLGPEVATLPGEEDSGEQEVGRGWAVNLRRDVRELRWGVSRAAERTAYGDTVLLLDGTLLPWDLDSRQVPQPLRERFAAETRQALDELRAAPGPGDIAMGAYISASRSADVVTSLRQLSDHRGAWPQSDGQFFARLLRVGERTAVFRAFSERALRVEQRFPEEHQVCFFYLRSGDDIARVELPLWQAEDERRVALLHATLVDQCNRCDGYPRALQEAHEQAVISGGDRQQFAALLERLGAPLGLRSGAAGKAASKRRRAL